MLITPVPFLLSEPPHVRNWFSSYVYESPVLDTLDDFKESVTKERVCAKEGFAYEGSEGKKEDNFEYESRNSWNSNEVDAGGGTLRSTGPVHCENTFEDTCVNQPSNEVLLLDPSFVLIVFCTINLFTALLYYQCCIFY